MKSKILKFLKEKWWKILLYFLVISLGMFVPFLYVDIKEFQLFLSKFGSVSSIMCIVYIIFWILTAAEENKIIMATMKAIGYSNGKVLTYVLAWYIFAFAQLGLGLPFLISYGAWIIIVRLIFNMTGILFTFAFSWQSIVIVVLALLALTVAETVFILLRIKKQNG